MLQLVNKFAFRPYRSAPLSLVHFAPPVLQRVVPVSLRMFASTQYKAGQPKTLQFQATLPRLPVPSLASSMDRYVTSLRPVLLEKALQEGKGPAYVEAELDQRRAWAADFIKHGGLGQTLQERLTGAWLYSSDLSNETLRAANTFFWPG